MPTKKFCVLLLPLAFFAAAIHAADSEDGDRESGKVDWKLSAQLRLRGEARDNLDLDDSVDDDLRFWLSRIRLGVEMTLEKDWGLFIQAQDSRIFGQEASTSANTQNLDLHQGYADLWKNRTWSLRLGRQEWNYGDQRLIGPLDWSNVGRSFNGARVRFKHDKFVADGLLAELSNQPNGTGGSTGSQFYALWVQNDAASRIHWEGYWLELADHVDMAGELGAPGTTRIDAVGGRGVYRVDRWDVELQGVYEGGRVDGDSLDAVAASLIGGYTFLHGGGRRTNVFGGYDFATGDQDPADGKREEFFNFFPGSQHKYYGYMDLFGWRNIRSYYGAAKYMWSRHALQAKLHQFSLESARGPWKAGSGAILGFDPTGQSGRDVGWEFDLTYNWAFRENAGLQANYSIFEPGRFAKSTRGPDTQYWAYLMLTLGF